MQEDRNDDETRTGKASPPSSRDRTAIARDIEENLKRVYQAALTEAVPDRFTQLLAQLREKEGKT